MISSKSLALFFVFCLVLCSGLEIRKHFQQENQDENYDDTTQNPSEGSRVKKTDFVGMETGSQFDESQESLSEVKKFIICSGNLVDSIQLEYENGQRSSIHGGSGGRQRAWTVPNGEHIARVQIRAGDVIDSIKFITDQGTPSPRWGRNGGEQYTIQIPEGYKIVGFFGGQGQWLDRIGFNIAPINENQ